MSPDPTRGGRSPNAVIALAALGALLVLVACGGLLWYASVAVNGITQARESRLMDRSVERRLVRLKDDMASVAVWNDAYEFTVRAFDPDWAEVNYGVYFHQYLHHDLSIVIDADDQPIYASVAGERATAAALSPFVRAAHPLAAQARASAAVKIAKNPKALGFDRVGSAEAAVRVGGRVYLASASTVVPEPEYARPLVLGSGPIVISAVEIDEDYLKELDADYGLKRARLVSAPASGETATLLRGPDGQVLAAIAWTPERPGIGVYKNAKWRITGISILVLTTVAMVFLRLRRLSNEVLVARDRAQAGDHAKSEFIANMSHEIRTPLNGILGMAQAMESYELSPDQRGRLAVIRESGTVLLGVLNDVLDLSKIEAGKVEVDEGVLDLRKTCEQVCATFAELASAKDVDLSISFEPGETDGWIGDALRIRQVLSNLVSNAVKFTAAGSVRLVVRPSDGEVRFSVADSGIGVADGDVARLFDKFSQADASTTRRYGGTGLGLPITRALVELMGGEIAVASRLGEGSTFTVTLPLRRGAALAPAVPASAAPASRLELPRLRILAAEDNPTNQLVLRALLGALDVDLTLAANGREALQAFERESFDVVLMDVQMPEMNGMDATRAIRKLEAERGLPRTPIVALTANVMSHQIESYVDAGMDGHVAKPVDAAALYAALEAAIPLPGDEQVAA